MSTEVVFPMLSEDCRRMWGRAERKGKKRGWGYSDDGDYCDTLWWHNREPCSCRRDVVGKEP